MNEEHLGGETRVIKACLFDLDGTLIDTTADIATAVNITRASLGLEALSEAAVALGIGHGADALLRRCIPEEHHPQLEALRETFIEAYRAHLLDHTHFYEGAEEALRSLKLRGVRLGVVTNKPSELTGPLLEHLGWIEGFDVVIGREHSKLAKPHPDPLFRAMSALEVSVEETLYVGDSEVDAQAALAAGLEFLVVPYGRAASDVHAGLYGPRARVVTWYDLRGDKVSGGAAERPVTSVPLAQSNQSAQRDQGSAEPEPQLVPEALKPNSASSLDPVGGATSTLEGDEPRATPRVTKLMLGIKTVTRSMTGGFEIDEALQKKLKEAYQEHFLGGWDLLIIALSIYTLIALILQQVLELSSHNVELLHLVDQVVCVFFLIDFVLRLSFNSDRVGYLKWGWLDLISSIPTLDSIRWGRTLRLIRLIRAMRAMRLLHKKLEHRLQDSFAMVLMSSFLMTTMSAIGVLYLERGAHNANITSASDALWWAWVTITTVGYGDFYPVTAQGRLLAMALMSAGVGLFSVFTVQCTRYFLDSASEEDSRELQELKAEVRALRELVLTLDFASRREPTSPADPQLSVIEEISSER